MPSRLAILSLFYRKLISRSTLVFTSSHASAVVEAEVATGVAVVVVEVAEVDVEVVATLALTVLLWVTAAGRLIFQSVRSTETRYGRFRRQRQVLISAFSARIPP